MTRSVETQAAQKPIKYRSQTSHPSEEVTLQTESAIYEKP